MALWSNREVYGGEGREKETEWGGGGGAREACAPCVSMSQTPTDLVYLTRSERALDSFMVFFFLRE